MQQTNQKFSTLMMWVLFFIYPLIACLVAIRNFQHKKYRIFILLFFVLFGYTFIPIPESDGDRYKQQYENIEKYSFNNYIEDITLVYDGQSINPDIYLETVTYISFLISSNYKFFFLLIGLVYFFVAIRLIGKIYDDIAYRERKHDLIIFIGIFTIVNLSLGLNGIRFPLAFWVFSYGAFCLIIHKKIKYLFIALAASLIHFSLFYSFIFLFLFHLFRYSKLKSNWLYLIVIGTVFFSELFPDLIASYLSFFGDTYSAKVLVYTNENYIEIREEHVKKWNWYIRFNQVSTYYFCIVSVILSKSRLFTLKFDAVANNFFKFSMFMLISTILSGSLVDSISNRYYLLFNFFALIYLFYLSSLNYGHLFLKRLRLIFIPILIIHVLVILRADLYSLNSTLVFGNAITMFFVDSSVSIYELFF